MGLIQYAGDADAPLSRVMAHSTLPKSDLQQIRERLQRPTHAHLRPLHVRPTDGNFDRLQAGILRNVQILDIEAESVQLLPRKDGLCGVAVVQFEAALRVAELQTRHQPHHDIECPSAPLAEAGLVYRYQRPV